MARYRGRIDLMHFSIVNFSFMCYNMIVINKSCENLKCKLTICKKEFHYRNKHPSILGAYFCYIIFIVFRTSFVGKHSYRNSQLLCQQLFEPDQELRYPGFLPHSQDYPSEYLQAVVLWSFQ